MDSEATIQRESVLSVYAFQQLVEEAQVAMCVLAGDRFRYVNACMAHMTGFTKDELVAGLHPLLLVAPEDRERAASQIAQRIAGVPGTPHDLQCLRKDGSRFHARAWGRRIDLNGEIADLVTMHDITELKQALTASADRAHLLAQTEELAGSGSCEYDVASERVTQSAGMFRMFGEPASEQPVHADWLLERVPPGEVFFVRGLLEAVRPGLPCEFEHRIVHRDGSKRTVLHRAMAECDPIGRMVRVVGLLQDITAQRLAEQQRDTLAQSDSITRLPNRYALLDHLDQMVRVAEREDRRVAVFEIKIGQLDLVTESFGYAGGDQLLALVGERLALGPLSGHTVAHIGSGRFAAIITGSHADESAARTLAGEVVRAFDSAFMIIDMEVMITCAIGVSLFPRDGCSADQLLHQAQAAAHRAQALGPNHCCLYSANDNANAAKRLALEAALRRALERQEFSVHYQPQLSLTSGTIVGAEALLRWTDRSTGLNIPPSEFIPVAEETGLIMAIGEWVLRQACSDAVSWLALGLPPLRVAVNLSVHQLQQPDIARRIDAIVRETGMDPQCLGLEITESVLMINSDHVARTLHELRRLGIEVSIDDFGTGYSNLSYLRTLPIDVVKVDRSFVHDVTAPPQDVSMTRAVITMAHSLQMKVLAEGVETEGQVSLLIANGCDQMQGYFFSPAVDSTGLVAMLRERRQLPPHLLARRQCKRTLLLVDDEPNILAAIKRLVRREGYNVVTACSGLEGLQRLAEQPVDVIVSDQRMPGMTGVEMLRRAKELYPETVRIVLSGYTELQSITDAINEGAIYKFLTKPWDDEQLVRHIQDAFRHKEMANENRRLAGDVQAAQDELSVLRHRLNALVLDQRTHGNVIEQEGPAT